MSATRLLCERGKSKENRWQRTPIQTTQLIFAIPSVSWRFVPPSFRTPLFFSDTHYGSRRETVLRGAQTKHIHARSRKFTSPQTLAFGLLCRICDFGVPNCTKTQPLCDTLSMRKPSRGSKTTRAAVSGPTSETTRQIFKKHCIFHESIKGT